MMVRLSINYGELYGGAFHVEFFIFIYLFHFFIFLFYFLVFGFVLILTLVSLSLRVLLKLRITKCMSNIVWGGRAETRVAV